jgi:hypothetical protein
MHRKPPITAAAKTKLSALNRALAGTPVLLSECDWVLTSTLSTVTVIYMADECFLSCMLMLLHASCSAEVADSSRQTASTN